jgi:threonine dehydratase
VIIPFPEGRPQASSALDVPLAAARVAPYIRRTPIMYASFQHPGGDWLSVHLKLENLQTEGGVELRGVFNAVLALPEWAVARGLVSVMGGGVYDRAVVAVSERLRVPVWLHGKRVRETTERIPQLTARGASVTLHNSWAAVERAAEEQARREHRAFLNPLANPEVIAGLGTVGLELLQGPAPPALVVVPANSSGGATLAGVAAAIKSADRSVRVVGVEVTRAPRLYESLRAGQPVALPPIAGYAGPNRASQLIFDLCRRYVDDIVLVTREEADAAVHRLYHEVELTASASGATAIAALLAGKVRPATHGNTYALVGGSGVAGLF